MYVFAIESRRNVLYDDDSTGLGEERGEAAGDTWNPRNTGCKRQRNARFDIRLGPRAILLSRILT